MKEGFRLSLLLEETYGGKPWYGKNVQDSLKTIEVGKVIIRLGESYNIAELLSHMIIWRKYVIRLLKTGKHTEVIPAENFPTINDISTDEWNDLVSDFADVHKTMSELAQKSNLE